MLKKTKVAVLVILTFTILAMAPLMSIAQGQIQANSAQQIVLLAERAAVKVQNLIDSVAANGDAELAIEASGLTDQYTGNLSLFNTEGTDSLNDAKTALASSDYDAAIDNAFDALKIFREVYSSINVILDKVGLRPEQLLDDQGLLEAITRELERIEHLRDILPEETPQEISDLLDNAEDLLNKAKVSLVDGDIAEAKSMFLEAKQDIGEVYQYLKVQAEESNEWRLINYCQGLQERVQDRLRYGRDQGVDVVAVLQSFGYQSESQLMQTIQSHTQAALGEQNFESALQDCEQVSLMVIQMDQAINQQMKQQQGQSAPGGNGSGSGYGGSGGKP